MSIAGLEIDGYRLEFMVLDAGGILIVSFLRLYGMQTVMLPMPISDPGERLEDVILHT